MPKYSYECQNCGYVSAHSHGGNMTLRNAVCPKCKQWARIKKIPSVCAFIINGHSAKNGYARRK